MPPRAIERTLKMRQADSMGIMRRRPRIGPIVLASRSRLGALALTSILLVAATAWAALAGEPFHYTAVLRNGKKIGDLVPGLSTLADVVKMFPAAPRDYPGNPRPPAGFPEVKIGKVRPEPSTVY